MGIVLGDNSYGKAETRLVFVDRAAPQHRIVDFNVTTALSGDLAATHLTGDNTDVLPTDSQKNTVFAFARDGVGEPEDFAARLARHFVESQPAIRSATVDIESYGWDRMTVGGAPAHHSFVRAAGTRTASVTYDGTLSVSSGITDLVVLNTTGSEFWGYPKDPYTTLAETKDRVLATAVTARWRHRAGSDWAVSHAETLRLLLETFAEVHSLSLQQTLYAMGRRVLEEREEVAEIRLELPNKHHIPVDLSPFGLDNPGVVFHATDRPYGLIQATVTRDDA
ncbi:urate oxidase [Fodinicola feengrottensis]|uniref:Uricase n=1 Tax=Fodinicola feengrottensis TaxID=435914 RepID=A0ABN2IQX9_9ACTN